ncbi:helix-turn-helix transcriptional regulator [Lysinibacillus capsici]|uniref:helix-turn-helix transcriptional regulator n=1 Tax=Lysinibacillus capsici TaxID=2115968 RepID=UPI00272F3326|nr:helix-turn-helix transcriptional regulator [Lysinibacillus capsici]MDP1394429.1 helix-turn-helix transcriptional regulator [Lysinibacillus capsici]MDP1414900.1 helix-turn-helix transcriptional regulator [Lysinibacillus capsici]MDP1430795.1 helix-turn-helix transcriptional regulator [Lysinibacillus capsici]
MYTRIKEIRNALSMNQTEFAQHLGLSQSTLAMIEVGKRTFNDKHIKIICSTFNINEDWLRTGKGEMFNSSLYEKELIDIFDNLAPETQEYLLVIAKELLNTQKKLLNSKCIKDNQ